MTTALVVGATGLTGHALVAELLQDERFTTVTAFVRRTTGIVHKRFIERIVDFERPDAWATEVVGDAAFSCLGTTKKQAGSLVAQRRVDVDYQRAFAEAAQRNGVSTFVLLSSAGADAESFFPYLRMKGELDDAVCALGIPRVRVVRPGSLDGRRERPRTAEKVSIAVLRWAARLGLARAYGPIHVATVARAMIASVFDGPQKRRTYALEDVFALAEAAL